MAVMGSRVACWAMSISLGMMCLVVGKPARDALNRPSRRSHCKKTRHERSRDGVEGEGRIAHWLMRPRVGPDQAVFSSLIGMLWMAACGVLMNSVAMQAVPSSTPAVIIALAGLAPSRCL